MFGTRESFTYHECDGCGSLYLAAVPENLSRYYPPDYYSFQVRPRPPWRIALEQRRFRASLGFPTWLGQVLCWFLGSPPFPASLWRQGIKLDARVLDVGCGGGDRLVQMQLAGYQHLTGIDPYLERDCDRAGIQLLKQEIDTLSGEFDLIMMHHSLEHIATPQNTLSHVRRLLAPQGLALIRVPVAQSQAHLEYGVNWVEWDAPRHLVIPSADGMKILAERSGLHLRQTVYDGNTLQFYGSELYRQGVTLRGTQPRHYFTRNQMRVFARRARECNAAGRGGRAAFYLSLPPAHR